jgi:hypothetical protein
MSEKEFKRRIAKMRKHTKALREIVPALLSDEASIDTIEVELNNLERRREDPDVQALAHAIRKEPKAVNKNG